MAVAATAAIAAAATAASLARTLAGDAARVNMTTPNEFASGFVF
jgi:hypothetical protein